MGFAENIKGILMSLKSTILLITNGFPYSGMEQSFLEEEFFSLIEKFDVTVIALGANANEHIDNEYYKEGVSFYPIPVPKLNPIKICMQLSKRKTRKEICAAKSKNVGFIDVLLRIGAVLMYSYRSEEYLKTIARIYDENNFELIYTFWCTPATVAAMIFSDEKNIKFITRLHGGDLYLERVKIFGSFFPFRHEIAVKTSKLLFLSESAKKYFRENWSVPESKCRISALGTKNFAQLPLFDLSKNTVSIVTTANAIKLKRIDLIIDAISTVDEKYNIIWNYVGDGNCWGELKKHAEKKISKKNIKWRFWGKVKNRDIPQLYNKVKASVFMLLSSTEGVPVSIEEALGMGLPVIATNVGGVSEEVIDNKTGYLLSANPEINEVVESIERFIELSIEKKAEMKRNAYRLWREKYDARRNAQTLINEIEELL